MSLVLKLLILTIVIAIFSAFYFIVRRKCSRAVRFTLDFTMGLYLLTYAAGCALLFIFRTEYLYYIFGGDQFLPTRASYELVLFVSVLPFAIVPPAARIFEHFLGRGPPKAQAALEISSFALWVGTMGTLLVSIGILFPVLGSLLINGSTGLLNTSDLANLYEQRRVAYDDTSWMQGGIIYTTLPSVSIMLLLWPSQRPAALRVVGILVGILAINLNLGLYQIGPTLSFVLSFAYCFVAVSGGRIDFRKLALPGLTGAVLLGAYSVIKTAGYKVDPVQAYLLRMPSSLPYLIQYAGEQPGTVAGGDFSLSFELAHYMYPDLAQYVGWVATPAPAFIDAYFTFNPLAAVLILVIVGLIIALTGRFFEIYWRNGSPRSPQTIFTGIIAAPVLYYVFQVDFMSLISSAYSALFALPPILATLIVNSFIPRSNGPRRRRIARSQR